MRGMANKYKQVSHDDSRDRMRLVEWRKMYSTELTESENEKKRDRG